MGVSATEEPESPQEGTGGAGPVLSRRYWPSRPLRYRRWARISISWSEALMLRPARAGRALLHEDPLPVGRRGLYFS